MRRAEMLRGPLDRGNQAPPTNPRTSPAGARPRESIDRMHGDGRPASPVRVAIVSGIFPPDVGGPATHAADLLEELTARGHPTTVVTLTDGDARVGGPNVVRFPRGRSWPA